jgi:CubicO group peptidase (beta-lactamase class C family)
MTVLRRIAGWEGSHQVAGAAAAVITLDGVVETVGDVDREVGLASVTKLLAAYAVLVALEEGAVGLDDAAGPSGSTLRHLLAHTSGYSFDSDSILAKPGRRRIYSNYGIEVLTDHLQRAGRVAFPRYLDDAVLKPLGMSATTLPGSSAHGGRSTVRDLSTFAAELLAPAVIAPETHAEAVGVQFPGLSGVLPGHGRFDPMDWGLGFERNFSRPGHWAGSRVSPDTFGHFGATGTFLWADPRARVACVCLTGRAFGGWARELWPPLCDAVIEEYATP